MASLIVTHGGEKGKCFKLDRLPMTAGREPSRDIQLLDPKVSRRHFRMKKEGENFIVEELDAKNGVYVEGKKVKDAVLKDGDRIVAGETELTFLMNDDPGRINAFAADRKFNTAARAPTMM